MKKIIRKIIPYSTRKKIKNLFKEKKIDIYKKSVHKINHNIKKVSVIIPNYNYENFIEERIDSVMRQSYPIYELIILDDGSKDKSIEKIKETVAKYDIKHHFMFDEHVGSVFTQWQKGFKKATGDFIWIAEADDSCSPYFLENVMKGFDDEDVVISYSESLRMNEHNEVIEYSCRDWMGCASNTYWNKSYIHDGLEEIRNVLSICNTVPNVSAVVFRKKNQIELIEEAKQFKISGDWHLYVRLLQNGKIAYCSKSLNYFRKHSQSASTVAKKEIELDELLTIQKYIRENVGLNSEQINRQERRYGNLIQEVSKEVLEKEKKIMAKKIAWIIPHPIKGSGGIRTMVQNANFLVSKGFEVDLYVEENYADTSKKVKERIIEFYGKCDCGVYLGIELRKKYDLVFATYSYLTPDYVYYMKDVKHKAYFIQDFEPWFEPMGGMYLQMERTYRYGLQGISIGKWLTHKLSEEFNAPMTSFPFCADLNIYKKIDVEKENAICFIHQPEKPRRCSELGMKALKLVKELRPDVKIYIYGSDEPVNYDFEVENLKIINIKKCNELYNKCKVGLCISSSNPSRIPFEMMAAGLPVVDLYRENNLYDIPEDGVLLAESTPEAIATAIIKILDDKKLQEKMSKYGEKFMKDYPLERGFEDFLKAVNDILDDKTINEENCKKLYSKEAITPSEETMNANDVIKAIPVPVSKNGKIKRFYVKTKRFIYKKMCKLLGKQV